MSCPKCGEDAEPGATYCLRPECGARLPLTDVEEREERAETAAAPGSDTPDPPEEPAATPDQAVPTPGDTTTRPGRTGADPGIVAAGPADAATKPGSGATPPGHGPTGPQSTGTGSDDGATGQKEGLARPLGRTLAVAAAVLGLLLFGTVVVLVRDGDPARQQATVPPPPAPVGQPMPSSLPSIEPALTAPTEPGGSGRPRDDNRKPAGDRDPADDPRRPSADDNQPEPTPRRTTKPPRTPRSQAPPAPAEPPSITASASAICYSDGTWSVRITGRVKNGSASTVWGFAQDDDYAYHGWSIGSGTSFSGEVHPTVGGSELTRSSTSWYVQATVNGKQIHHPTGTVSRSC
ncbi:ribosomal eL19 family protein [Plantactinospora sonchi]|uniref:Cellulose-binding protein n=1 Tax=Plantactinospora sonchi TaxID=1544735 RepID=A0ABU7RPG8_9ACTN